METIISNETKSSRIKDDFIKVLVLLEEKINAFTEFEIKEILLYFDGTNGGVFCSGFDPEKLETIDDTMIHFETEKLNDELENTFGAAVEFDIIAEKSIKKALKSKIGRRMVLNYKVILEDESGDQKVLK